MTARHAKPRYRGILNSQGKLEMKSVTDLQSESIRSGVRSPHLPPLKAVTERTSTKPRYRAEFTGTGIKVKPIHTVQPGHVETPEAETLRLMGNQERGGPVQITYFPTPTINPQDPRTAAAGYDKATRTLRVEWGDGGVAYNYYDVDPAEWRGFRRAKSPGRYINRRLNDHTYGPA